MSKAQILALALAGLLLSGVVIGAILDAPRVAVVMIGVLATGAFLASIQARRRAGLAIERVGGGVNQVRRDIRRLDKYLATSQDVTGDFATRRLLAVIESERLASAERHAELIGRVSELEQRIDALDSAGGGNRSKVDDGP